MFYFDGGFAGFINVVEELFAKAKSHVDVWFWSWTGSNLFCVLKTKGNLNDSYL